MPELIGFLLVALLVFFLVRRTLTKARSNAARERRMHEGGLKPDYVARGSAYISLEDASNSLGESSLKFMLALYQQQRFIRLFFWRGVSQGADYDVRFEEIDNIEYVRAEGGVYGPYLFAVCAIETHSTELPQSKIYIATENLGNVIGLCDELIAAIKS